MSPRDSILSKIRHAEQFIDSFREMPSPVDAEIPAEADWALFTERLDALGGHTITLSERPFGAAVLRALDDLGIPAGSAFVDDDAAEIAGMVPTGEVWSADVGITLADAAIAESGSLLIRNTGGRYRLASLAPPAHVALVERKALVGTLAEAMAKFEPTRTSAIVTGPSRTADIEGVLVRGVHGPRHLLVAVYKMPEQPSEP